MDIKKAIIYVFSGSGNTLKIARLYKDEFEAKGVETTIYEIDKDYKNAPDALGYDIAGFAYPIHAFNPPEIFIDFAKSLKEAKGIRSFIFKTSGEPLWLNDSSSQQLIKILSLKGYDIINERHIVMPYNMIFRHRDEVARQLYIYARALTKAYAEDALYGERENLYLPLMKRVHSTLFKIEWGFAKFNGRLFRVSKKKCIYCGKCERNCPVSNIRIVDKKFKFGNKCTMCTRCSMFCPTNAINIGILNSWKVNGDYQLDKKLKDDSIKFPYISDETKGLYKSVYLNYFKKADKLLKERNIRLEVLPSDEIGEYNLAQSIAHIENKD